MPETGSIFSKTAKEPQNIPFSGSQLGLDAGYLFNVRSELRAGYKLQYITASRRIGDNLFPTIKGRFSNAFIG